ncbi:MAG: sugar-binding protein [Elusimicrobiota bacterium]|jgi:putative multiple sugar transport system substrate-binding protein|nr:sugar-binding protein [Elusimicrobiota bacterium]
MKKIFFVFTVLLFIYSLVSIASGAGIAGKNPKNQKHIALLLPSAKADNLNIAADILTKLLESRGYKISIADSQNSASLQISQIEKLTDEKTDMLIIAPVRPAALSKVIALAKEKNIKIIAFDKMIENAPIDFHIGFDAFQIGVLQGKIIEKTLGLNIQQKGPFYFEIFSSPKEYSESILYYKGALSVLAPYLAKQRLRNRSGRFSFDASSQTNIDAQEAQKRMEYLLSKYYVAGGLDAVLCAEDNFASGIIEALKKAGYKTDADFPIITGQNCLKENVKAIIDGEQTASVFKDYRILAEKTAEIADAVLNGKSFKNPPQTTYKYGNGAIPSILLDAKIVYKNDIQKEIFDSKYYKKAEILKIK